MQVRRTPPRLVRPPPLGGAPALIAALLIFVAGPARADPPPPPLPAATSSHVVGHDGGPSEGPPSPPAASAPLSATPAPAPQAAPAASAASTPAASAEAHAPAAGQGAAVRIHDRRIFEVLVRRAGRSPNERAAEASRVVERLLEESEEPEVRVQEEGDVAVVYGGKSPIIQLGPEDAAAAGDASAAVHAQAVAAKIHAALRAERQRSAIATTVFAFSLLVFSGLIAFLLVRKVGELIERLRGWVDANPAKLPALRVRDIEVVQQAAVRGGIDVALSVAILVSRIGILYAWVLIALSLFDATRGYSERLTGFVLSPVSALMGRVASALPVLVIALVTVLAVGVTLRFVRLFFGSVARGETTVGWMPRDLAEPTSILVRAGIVLVTVVVAAPLITGTDDGTLARAGVAALFAIGLAATPLLACAAAGIAVVFGRRLRVGDLADVGGQRGRVRALTMLEVLLDDDDGCAVHVPHLLGLWHPTRVIGSGAQITVEISADAGSDLGKVIDLLREAAGTVGSRPRVDVQGLDEGGAHLRVAIVPRPEGKPSKGVAAQKTRAALADLRNALYCALAAALKGEGVRLGRRGERPS